MAGGGGCYDDDKTNQQCNGNWTQLSQFSIKNARKKVVDMMKNECGVIIPTGIQRKEGTWNIQDIVSGTHEKCIIHRAL